MIALNRSVAVAMVEGPNQALAILDTIRNDGELQRHHLYWATRADLLRRAGDTGGAVHAYNRALELTDNGAEQRFLRQRIVALSPLTHAT